MSYKRYVWFAIVVCIIALFACTIIGALNEWEMLGVFILVGAAEFVLVWIFVIIGRGFCPNCDAYGTMREVKREFCGLKTIERNVPVTDFRTYKIDGKVHTVREMYAEKRYEKVEVWRCLERCTKCGCERIVERTN